ncbi:TPA: hypothetical protein HA231_02120 [Candidatus Woesearchaeota archaeon]|nr:hypothetical protein [Candidatus Woesearchaeota archaeon]
MDAVAELRKHVQAGNLVTGTKETMQLLRQGKASRIFITSNCPATVMGDLKHYCSLSGCELVELSVPNDELGVLCKKPFSISVVAVPKQ